jgi:hypothetical protein
MVKTIRENCGGLVKDFLPSTTSRSPLAYFLIDRRFLEEKLKNAFLYFNKLK